MVGPSYIPLGGDITTRTRASVQKRGVRRWRDLSPEERVSIVQRHAIETYDGFACDINLDRPIQAALRQSSKGRERLYDRLRTHIDKVAGVHGWLFIIEADGDERLHLHGFIAGNTVDRAALASAVTKASGIADDEQMAKVFDPKTKAHIDHRYRIRRFDPNRLACRAEYITKGIQTPKIVGSPVIYSAIWDEARSMHEAKRRNVPPATLGASGFQARRGSFDG